MPVKPSRIVTELCERVARLEEAVSDLKLWVKVMVGVASTTFAGVLTQILIRK